MAGKSCRWPTVVGYVIVGTGDKRPGRQLTVFGQQWLTRTDGPAMRLFQSAVSAFRQRSRLGIQDTLNRAGLNNLGQNALGIKRNLSHGQTKTVKPLLRRNCVACLGDSDSGPGLFAKGFQCIPSPVGRTPCSKYKYL